VYGKRDAVRSALCTMLWGAVGGWLALFTWTSSAFCQTAQENPEPIVNYVPSSALTPDNLLADRANAIRLHLREPLYENDGVMATPPTTRTSADRWRKFDEEYGIQQKSPSRCLQLIQSAKYGLDTIAFGTEEVTKKLEFTYDLGVSEPAVHQSGNHGQGRSIPLFGDFGQAQLKSVVTAYDPQTGQALAGLKLAIPFGPGGPRGDRYSERRWGADAAWHKGRKQSPNYFSQTQSTKEPSAP